MKSTLGIILGILVLVGIAWFATNSRDHGGMMKSADTVESQKTSNDSMPNMTAEEHARMMADEEKKKVAEEELPPEPTREPEMKMLAIAASNFAYDQKEIRVRKGDTVMIHFKSPEGTHDLVIDEFNVRTEKVSGETMSMVQFVADKVGTFEYYCSVGNHRAMGMVGKLIVEE